MNYEQLVNALRCKRDDCEGCDLAFFDKDEGWMCQYATKDDDAAAAIGDLLESVGMLDKQRSYWIDKAAEYYNQLPKRGEWIEEDLDNFRKYKVTCPHCGAWYVGNYDAYDEPWDFNYCPHCGNICNPTNLDWENELKEREKEARAKMEVQE